MNGETTFEASIVEVNSLSEQLLAVRVGENALQALADYNAFEALLESVPEIQEFEDPTSAEAVASLAEELGIDLDKLSPRGHRLLDWLSKGSFEDLPDDVREAELGRGALSREIAEVFGEVEGFGLGDIHSKGLSLIKGHEAPDLADKTDEMYSWSVMFRLDGEPPIHQTMRLFPRVEVISEAPLQEAMAEPEIFVLSAHMSLRAVAAHLKHRLALETPKEDGPQTP